MTTYVVTAPLVQVETTARNFVQLTTGTEVPSNVTDAALANLIDLGYVEKAESTDAPASKASVPNRGSSKAESTDAPASKASVPTRGSSKADWVAYATDEARGEDRLSSEDAEKLNRDDLAVKYLGAKEES